MDPRSRRVAAALLCAALLVAGAGSGTFASAQQDEPVLPGMTRLGVAEADITYRIGASQGGFGARWRVYHEESQPIETNMYARLMKTSEGVHMNLRVKAFVFETEGRKLAILSNDLLGTVQFFHRAIARELADDPGIAWDDLLIVGTHTESGPSNGTLSPLLSAYADFFDEEFARHVLEQAVRAVRAAADNLEPVRFAAGSTEVDAAGNFVYNSTEPPLVDRGLDLLRFDRLDGTTKGLLVAYPGHFTIAGVANPLISSDGPGYVERFLERRISAEQDEDVLVGYLPGTVGDSGVRGTSEENIYQSTEGRARILSDAAAEVFASLEPRDDFVVDSAARRFPPPPGHEVPNFPLLGYAPIPFMVSHSLHAQVFRVGDAIFAGVPGEPVTELGHGLRERIAQLGFEHPIPLSHANDWTGYIYTDEQYDEQEGRSDQGAYGRDQGWYLVDKLVDLARSLVDPSFAVADFERSLLMTSDDTLNESAAWAVLTATPVTGELRDAAVLPNVVLECGGLADADDVNRFDRTGFTWRGGNNGADFPRVELQRQDGDGWQAVLDAEGFDLKLWMKVYRVQPFDPIMPGEPGCNELLDHTYSVELEPAFDFPAGTYRFVASGVFRRAPTVDEGYTATSAPFRVRAGTIDATLSVDDGDVIVELAYPSDGEGWRWRPHRTLGGTAEVEVDGVHAGTATFDPSRGALVLEGAGVTPGQTVTVQADAAFDPWGNALGQTVSVVAD